MYFSKNNFKISPICPTFAKTHVPTLKSKHIVNQPKLIMDKVLNLGKYIYAVPFALFGIMHLMNANAMAGMAPFGGAIIVYITGLALIAAAVSIIIGKMDKLGAALLGVMLLLFALLVHGSGVANAADDMAAQMSMSNMLKDLALAGAAWMYAAMGAKDNAVIG